MTSAFDFDDSINTIYNAKTAGKNLVTAKHEVLTKAGEFLFLAHSDKEFALRCQMMEADIESSAKRKMASVSDSKFKLVRALHEEWKIRHANCEMCKTTEASKFATYPTHVDDPHEQREYVKQVMRSPIVPMQLGELDVANEAGPEGWDFHKNVASKSPVQQKISSLETRINTKTAMAMELDRVGQNKSDNSIESYLDPETSRNIVSKLASRRADLPEMQNEAKAGRWAVIAKHAADGSVQNVTLGRILGPQLGGEASTSPLICTGTTHHGQNGTCVHEDSDAFGGRHIAMQETPLSVTAKGLVPDLANRREASIYTPSHRVYILPQEHHDYIEKVMDHIASNGLSIPEQNIEIAPFNREEDHRGEAVETLGRGTRDPEQELGVNTIPGRSLSVGAVHGFTLWPSDKHFGHFEQQVGKPRGGKEGYAEQLESGPRDITKGRSVAGAITLKNGLAGSGRVLPVVAMLPEYNQSDDKKGLQGALEDGSLAQRGVTARLRPVSWGNSYDAGTFRPLGKKIKSVGEELRKKLVGLDSGRLQRISDERSQNPGAEKGRGNSGRGNSGRGQATSTILDTLFPDEN